MRLFEPIRLGPVSVPNRIVKSAMVEGLASAEGHATDRLVALYRRWAEGGVGLCITGMTYVLRGWSLTPYELGLYDDSAIEPLRQLTRAVHRYPTRIFVQLCHASPQLFRSKALRLGSVAPSAGFNRTNLLFDRALHDSEIRRIARAFGAAARRARAAEADGVELHAAHGYLLSRFISPLHNRRDDAWGGDPERRLALLRLVCHEIQEQAGADFPILVKLNAHDGVPGGLGLEEAVRIAERLEQWGIVGIEVSAGTADVGLGFYPNQGQIPLDLGRAFLTREFPWLGRAWPLVAPLLERVAERVALRQEAYFGGEARRFAEALSIPVIQVGGIRTRDTAETILSSSRVAMVGLGRPLVRRPSLPHEWRTGTRAAAGCISCNRCFVRLGLGEPLFCDRAGQG